jgi:uncharacterized membrane protein YdjX (TVP38/TMEM64 family)
MVLLRLSPLIPFNALDYISGITSISLKDYAIALVGILPGAIVLCFAGASASSLTPDPDEPSSTDSTTIKIIAIVSGILFGGCGVYLVSYYSKLELDRVSGLPHYTCARLQNLGFEINPIERFSCLVSSTGIAQ